MIDEIKARIAATVPMLKLVGEAADFQSAVETNPTLTPACFVYLLEEKPEPCATGNLLIQRVHAGVGVVLVVKNLKDNKGVAARGDMETLRKLVKAALFGWQPTTGLDPLERGNGFLLAFRDGHMWWQDSFLTQYYDRSEL